MQMWSVKISVGQDGTPHVDSFTSDVPGGEIEVRGYDDGNAAVLTVRQRDHHGRFVTSAYHRRDRAEEALDRAEDLAAAVTDAGGTAAVTVAVAGEIPAE